MMMKHLIIAAIAAGWCIHPFIDVRLQPSPAAASEQEPQHALSPKITFDLSQISEQGLIGQPGALRSLSYEFCIPATNQALAKIHAIDPTLTYSRSRGRIGCRSDQYLVIGHTHHPNWRDILTRLAHLSEVDRIDEFLGE